MSERAAEAYAAACAYIAPRERCSAEVKSYLARKGFDPEAAGEAIGRLLAERLVDDMRYARLFAESRARRSPRSGRLLIRELRERGVDAAIAEEAVAELLREVPERELARRIVAKVAGSGQSWLGRAARRLQSRGFHPSLALELRGDGERAGAFDEELGPETETEEDD